MGLRIAGAIQSRPAPPAQKGWDFTWAGGPARTLQLLGGLFQGYSHVEHRGGLAGYLVGGIAR